MKPKRTWIVITDGARSRILLNEGPGKGVNEIKGSDTRAPHPEDREINSDRPGQVFESAAFGQHALEPTLSPHRKNKIDFIKDLADYLAMELSKDRFDRIVIAASPKSLGDLRASLPQSVKDRIVGEVAKDLTHIRDEDLSEHLKELIFL